MTNFFYDVSAAVLAINPSAQLIVTNEDIDTIEWLSGTTPIAKSTIQAKQAELKTAWDAKDYSRKRKVEYDQLNQLELQYDDLINGTTTWKNAILAIKAKYPKP